MKTHEEVISFILDSMRDCMKANIEPNTILLNRDDKQIIMSVFGDYISFDKSSYVEPATLFGLEVLDTDGDTMVVWVHDTKRFSYEK